MLHTTNPTPTPPFRVAVSPLSWTNDVLQDLGDDTSVEKCLAEARQAGFAGVELGRKFPRDAKALAPLLATQDLQLASGWYSGFLAERDVATEMAQVADHATLLRAMGTRAMVYGECGRMVADTPLDAPMSQRLRLQADEFGAYAERLTDFATRLQGEYGLQLAYHHHLMMVAETLDEIGALFERTGPAVGLLLDTGHAAAGGFDYRVLLQRFGQRIVHIHLKDVRPEVLQQVRSGDASFNHAVRSGMFTVPGDGCIDFAPLADFVHSSGYAGWLVVEAEQDPLKAPPLPTVTRARQFIAQVFENPFQA